jgi:predicted GIY-YIG superfamily endonuclease
MTGYVYMTASQKRGTIYIGLYRRHQRHWPANPGAQGGHWFAVYFALWRAAAGLV